MGDKQGAVKAIEVVKTKLGEFDTSGRRRPIPTDEVVRVDCDTVILAVGEKVDPDFAKASGLKVKEAGTLEVDRYSLETSRERFFAGGDLISGASNVSNAMGYGKKAARDIDKRLMGVSASPPSGPSSSTRRSRRSRATPAGTCPGEVVAATRVESNVEVSLGLTPVAAKEETTRCLRATSAARTAKGGPA